jgi:hypothetical protein
MEIALTIVIIGILLFLHLELRRIETQLRGPDETTHDTKIDDKVSEECRPFQARKDKFVAEKKALPGISLWDIAGTPDWEAQLMTKAEALRNLIVYAVDSSPDAFYLEQRARKMPMTHNLAHALATFAALRQDIGIKRADWGIQKIKLLGLMRKRGVGLSEIVYAEQDLRETEQEMKTLEAQWEARRKGVVDAVLEDIRASGDATMSPPSPRMATTTQAASV